MYCPVCGDEFREGVTRCPDDDVDLVEEPPELEEPLSWLERLDNRTAVRVTFIVLVVTAAVYALTGSIGAALLLFIETRDRDMFETVQFFQHVQSGSSAVAIAALGTLSGALLLRAYLTMSTPERTQSFSKNAELVLGNESGGPIGRALMRVLFALTVLFALLWAGTGIATSRERAEYSTTFGFQTDQEEPDSTFLTLLTLNYVGYAGGLACLAVMGAGLLVGGHQRLRRPNGKAHR
ncbi:MAG: hypothetical protein M3280_13970 [Actinomycetota bacterium]|nr:hypothetical protein [Actinomycetota bacterium]